MIPAPEPSSLPLDDLDRSLRPLRRVLAWAAEDTAGRADRVPYLGANGTRWLAGALRLDVPAAVREPLDAIAAGLDGFDAASDRAQRLRAMYVALTRLDAWLGLPLDGKPAPALGDLPPPDALPEREGLTEEGAGPAAADEVADPAEDDGVGEKRFRLGDPAHTGAALADLVDPDLAAALAEEGVETIADLLLLPTVGETVLKPIHGAGRDMPSGRVAVGGRVRRRVTRLVPGSPRHTTVLLHGAGDLLVQWTRPVAAWFVEALAPERRIVLVGQFDSDRGALLDPEPAVSDGHAVRLAHYRLEGIDDAVVRVLLWRFLPMVAQVRDPLDDNALARLELPPLGDAIRDVHQHGSARPDARRRMAFDEALLLQLGLISPRFQGGRERGIAHAVTHGSSARLAQIVEAPLDDAQSAALEDIKRDLRSTTPMLRVLTGPAGAGKFLVALHTVAIVAEAKAQVVVLAPDAMAAELRFVFAEPLLRELGLVARFVVGDPTRTQRDALRRGEVHVVFGTPDLLEREVEFRRLGLVVACEFEPWGRVPAKVAALRAPRPDLLVIGPTPVPAAVMLSAYGDCDLSVLRGERPWPKVSTVPEEKRDEAYKRAVAAVAAGRQALVVFPMARAEGEEGTRMVDVLDLREARQVVDALAGQLLPGLKVALFHGQLPREDRLRVYDDFRHRRCDVLVATAPVEDGPPVHAATTLVVEQADRMPLHRLLRLVGHVSGGVAEEAEVAFVTGRAPDAAGVERIRKVQELGDAWAIAEWDAKNRGLEPLIARDVHGGVRLRWLDPVGDRELLVLAREEAHGLLADDPGLRRGPHGDIGKALRERWDELLSMPCPLPDAAGGAPSPNKKRRRRRKRK